jgi:hypothetical protein
VLQSHFDHLVITAPNLEAGVAFLAETLGVSPEPGGRHLSMGTHNCLLRLGNADYLEVIAIDPSAPKPARPRWFRLDQPDWNRMPRLSAWVARTNQIQAALRAYPFGQIESMHRGAFDWRIGIPQGGELPFAGIAPMLIQWDCVRHPASFLEDRGCSLVRLEGLHPCAPGINKHLRAIGLQGPFSVSAPGENGAPQLIAHIQTPQGLRVLNSSGAIHG